MNNNNFIFNSSGDNNNNNNDDNNYYSHTNNSDNLLALGQGDSMSTFNSASPTSSISPSSNNPGLSNNSNQAPSESVLSNFFHTTNNSNPSLKKLTNRHTTSKKPKRKRATNIRACDTCAAKKVKCDANRPCGQCRTNNLECTHTRERKKTGPKTPTQKALESINNLTEVIEINANGKRKNLSRTGSNNSAVTQCSSNELTHDRTETENSNQPLSSRNSASPPISTGSSLKQCDTLKQIVGDNGNGDGNGTTDNNSVHQQNLEQLQGKLSLNDTSTSKTKEFATSPMAVPSATTIEDYIVTPFHLMENINLIGEEPSILELVRPLTVDSVILNYVRLVEFLVSNYPDSRDGNYQNNPRYQELNLIDHHDNSLYLSTLLIILTLNQIIAEVLIKLKKQKFKKFVRYPKKYLLSRPFKNFKNLCHFKVLEIFTLIEKNFIVPPVIPQNRAHRSSFTSSSTEVHTSSSIASTNNHHHHSNNNNNNNNGQIQSFMHLNHYQIYYNLSLSSIQLCNYYHILNLTNTLNYTNLNEYNYGNEAQEHQKILYMHRAITYFQLINVRNSDAVDPVQELYELLYSCERYYLVMSSHNYNINVTRNNDIVLQLRSNKYRGKSYTYELMRFLDSKHTIDELCYKSNFNVLLNYTKPVSGYFELKTEMNKLNATEPIHKIIHNIVLFKLLLIKPLNFVETKQEIVTIIRNLNLLLEENDSDTFKIKISNYQIIQPMLHCLKSFLEIKQVEVKLGTPQLDLQDQVLLVRFSENLILHFPFFNNINKLIRAHKILNNWFLNLSEIKKDDLEEQNEKNQQQGKLQSLQQPIQPSPQQPLASLAQQQQQQPQEQQPLMLHNLENDLQNQILTPTPDSFLMNFPMHNSVLHMSPNLNQVSLQQKIASQINLNELLRDLNGTPSSTTDFINQYNNFKVPDTLISTNSNPITQHQADDEEEDVIDNEEDDAEDDQDQFFSIVPQNQHGHKFANLQAPQPVSNTGSNTLNNGPVTTATPSGAIGGGGNNTGSFLSLFNATNFVDDQADGNNGATGVGSSFFNLYQLNNLPEK